MVDINIMHNFDAIEDFFSREIQSVASASVRAALKKTIRTGRKKTLEEIHKRINLNSRVKTKTAFGKEQVKTWVKGGNAFDTEGVIAFKATPMPMLWFARGKIENIKQKGIKISKRKSPKVEIYKGKKFTVKKAFIQTHHSKQIFKRDGDKAMVKQGIPSISHMVENSRLKNDISKMLQKDFHKHLTNQIKFRLEKAVKDTNRKALKRVR